MKDWEAIWAVLGLEATADLPTIRRAYARRLKTIDQAREPDAFAMLRDAYEAAMKAAQSGGEVRNVTVRLAETPASPTPQTPERPPAPERSPEVRAILQAIVARDVVSAARLLRQARRECGLALAEDMALANQLLLTLAHDIELDGAAVEEAALMLGWHAGGEDYRRSPEMERLARRLDAEHWYRLLLAATQSWRVRLTSQGAAARLMLGKGRIRLPLLVVPGASLMQAFASYGLYGVWLRGRFDAERLAHIDTVLKSRRALFLRKVMPRVRRFALRHWRALVFFCLVVSWILRGFGR